MSDFCALSGFGACDDPEVDDRAAITAELLAAMSCPEPLHFVNGCLMIGLDQVVAETDTGMRLEAA